MPRHNTTVPTLLGCLLLAGACCLPVTAGADATLVYETVTDKNDKVLHTFGISGRFVRVSKDTEPDRYWVIDAGLLTLADVDVAGQRYTFTKLPRGMRQESGQDSNVKQAPAAAPRLSPQPVLVPTRNKRNIAQVLCREVRETHDGDPVALHCMAGTGPLGLTNREMVTLSRLFMLARRLDLGWAGVATADERIASVESRLQDGSATQILQSVSHDPIPDAAMQVPKRFKRVARLEADAGEPAPAAESRPAQPDPEQAPQEEATARPVAPAGG
jgi:hypothetical protein